MGERVIEHILERTSKSKDQYGDRFPKYSKSYVQSVAFKSAGKSPRKINLELSGDMLAALQVLNHSSGNLRIGFENGSEENSKAEGNILGSYGGSPNPDKARDFLGIDKSKLRELITMVRNG